MNSAAFEKGRHNFRIHLQRIRSGQYGALHNTLFVPVFYSKADYEKAYALVNTPQSELESYEDYREKMRGALTVVVDSDPIRFTNIMQCLTTDSFAEAKERVHLDGLDHIEMSVLAVYFGLKHPEFVLKPSQVFAN
jgi:hypothetical protein